MKNEKHLGVISTSFKGDVKCRWEIIATKKEHDEFVDDLNDFIESHKIWKN